MTAEVGIERFTASGLVIEARNFLDVYPYIKWEAKMMPHFAVGETFMPKELTLKSVRSLKITESPN